MIGRIWILSICCLFLFALPSSAGLTAAKRFLAITSPSAAVPFVWTGLAGNNLWNASGNWSTNAVPGSSDLARFYGANCSGGACNATVNVSVSVGGIIMDSAYAGTITQASGNTMALGSSGWSQAGGTFTGGNSDIVITAGAFALSGGTFTSTSANFKIAAASGAGYTVFSQSSGTFNAGAGTLYFAIASAGCVNGTHYTIDVNSSLTVANLRYAGGHPSAANLCYWDLGASDSLTATGNFNMATDLAVGTIAASGTINVQGDLTYGTGTNGGTLSVTLNGTGTQNISQTAGTTLPSGTLTINKATGTAYMATHLTFSTSNFTLASGTFERTSNKNLTGMNGFTLAAGTTFRDGRGSVGWSSGSFSATSTIEVIGNGGTWGWSGTIGHVIFNHTGTLTLTMGVTTAGDLTIGTGTLSSAGYYLSVAGNWSSSGTYVPGTSTVGLNGTNQSINGTNTFYNLTKTATAAQTLTFAAGTTQTITNTLTLTGSANLSRLSLRSSSPATQWSINPQGTRSVQYLDVQDSNNTNATAIAATDSSLNSGNNTNWTFVSATPEKKVFLTSTSYTGSLGGVTGADAKCATQATAAGLAGVYKAWIAVTTGTNDPATTFTQATVPYKMVDGTTIANNWTGLISGSLLSPITLDETGAASGGAANRWTNVATNGTASSSGSGNSTNCTGWTSANGARDGKFGSPGSSTGTWTDNSPTTIPCNTATVRLLCFQQ